VRVFPTYSQIDLEKNQKIEIFLLLLTAADKRCKFPCVDELAFSANALSIFQWTVLDFYFCQKLMADNCNLVCLLLFHLKRLSSEAIWQHKWQSMGAL